MIAVTWLTSSGQAELDALGLNMTPQQMVSRLAGMTQNAGLAGVVCSAQEAPVLRKQMGLDQPVYVRYFDWLIGNDWRHRGKIDLPLKYTAAREGDINVPLQEDPLQVPAETPASGDASGTESGTEAGSEDEGGDQ